MDHKPACIARTAEDLDHHNKLVTGPRIVIEFWVRDLAKQSVHCRAHIDSEYTEATVQGDGRGTGACFVFEGYPCLPAAFKRGKLTIESSRKFVMKRPSNHEKLGVRLKEEHVTYWDDLSLTERQYAVISGLSRRATPGDGQRDEARWEFEQKRQGRSHATPEEHNVNEIVLLWDEQENRLLECAIDGETVAVEPPDG